MELAKKRISEFRSSLFSKRVAWKTFIFPGFAVGFAGFALIVIGLWWGEVKRFDADRQTTESVTRQLKEELLALQNQDQFKRNNELEATIKNIEKTYTEAVGIYEDLLDLQAKTKIDKLTEKFAGVLSLLAKRNYASASADLVTLRGDIAKAEADAAATFTIPANVVANNAPPGSGYSRQSVNAEGTNYLVDIIAGDLGTTRVIVDTASNETCKQDCPVLSLGEYVARSGAYAGINGSYFCPADYPSCADKKNSFDTLLMNKNKVYFNSDNNVYSTVPAVIFLGGSVRFVSRSLDWGRDTGIDSMIANQPLLLMGGNITFGGDEDPKKGSRGSRSFVARKDNTVYIGIVHNATVAESARVMKAMGMGDALNLDSGGSTALWSGGYKAGPGRNIPNAILFVRR